MSPSLKEKKKQVQTSQKNTLRKRRVVIVDPETNKEMSVQEAYKKGLIDYDTFKELCEQECEWEEITITGSDGSTRVVLVDRKTGSQYDIQDTIDKGLIDRKFFEQYRSGSLSLTQFADMISLKNGVGGGVGGIVGGGSSTGVASAMMSLAAPDTRPSVRSPPSPASRI